ncbi:MAG: hypothetical protein ABIP81_06070 [Terriglobales bacterium]
MNSDKDKPADKENLFAQVTRMSQEKRAVSDRRAQARRVTEQVEISRQIAARAPLPKVKPIDAVNAAALQLDPAGEADDDSGESESKVDRSA